MLLIALAAVIVAGVAYGLAQIGGSGGSSANLSTGQPWLGVELSQPPGGGVIVGRVFPGGPGERAGIQPGDVVMAVGNQAVSSPADVESAIDNLRPGERVSLTVLRGANSYTTFVRLGGRPAGTP
jgi:S1-C subfamily serine protease